MLRVHTFNTNGGSKEKLKHIPSITLDNRYVNIILVQEAGTDNTSLKEADEITIQKKPFICMMRAHDPQSPERKCSTFICIEVVYDIIKDLTEEYPYGVNRPLVIAKIKEKGDAREYLVATIHAVADDTQSVAQIKASLKKLCEYDMSFALMGDFNSQPDRYIPAASINTARPGKKIKLNDDFSRPVYIIYPNGFTQGANGNRSRLLDYVFVSDGINVSDLRNMRIVSKENKTVSDHNMVSVTVGLV